MNRNDEQLAHLLKIKFGLSPYEPSEYHLRLIKLAIRNITDQGGIPNKNDWQRIVSTHCKSFGTHVYAGQDNSDLVLLLRLAKDND
ncbi:hypothetical protein [Pectobacterium brasiliense]|uniref:hypothetical protein n=1 Tax=Pectobacterium brasiliense TaxID=180957 RepID=UPI002A7EAE3F|nr:hypothetical protein [Pectobacterium brasiliense]MDY4384724.1 hypothetical protein [Pectobacterium brasiliense]